jgi:DNA-binding NtrC family response regulator
MRAILSAAERIATADVGVLIVGEKGTGKELLARYIHAASRRGGRSFIRVDCQEVAAARAGTSQASALAQGLTDSGIEAELVGRARGGTLFLDHLSALAPEAQERLLWSLLGETGSGADVRLLAARDPSDAVPACLATPGLALIELPLPALRQRRSDIPVLVEHFLELYGARHGVGPCAVDTEAMVHLWQYDWPGNVRELESVVERVVVLSHNGRIHTADLPPHLRGGNGKPPSGLMPTANTRPHGVAALR